MSSVTPQDFIKAWVDFKGDRAAVAKELGVTLANVNQRAAKYRKLGIRLPKYRIKRGLNVAELNKFIVQYKRG